VSVNQAIVLPKIKACANKHVRPADVLNRRLIVAVLGFSRMTGVRAVVDEMHSIEGHWPCNSGSEKPGFRLIVERAPPRGSGGPAVGTGLLDPEFRVSTGSSYYKSCRTEWMREKLAWSEDLAVGGDCPSPSGAFHRKSTMG
jgi:hypothetical protein